MRWGLLVFCCACGRVNFDAAPDALDALGAFSMPVPIDEITSGLGEDDPSLTADLLEIYFHSKRTPAEFLYVAKRPSRTSPWSAPVLVDEINAGGNSNNTRVTPDGLTLVFASARAPNAGADDLWISTRATRSSPWSPPQRVTELATAVAEYEPWLPAGDSLSLYCVLEVAGEPQLAVAQRPMPGQPFGPATLIAELSSPTYDGGAWVTPNEQLILFHSLRDAGTAGSEFYVSTRASAIAPWDAPEPWPLNSSANDSDPWLSPDGTTFVFTSGRGDGTDRIYIATR